MAVLIILLAALCLGMIYGSKATFIGSIPPLLLGMAIGGNALIHALATACASLVTFVQTLVA